MCHACGGVVSSFIASGVQQAVSYTVCQVPPAVSLTPESP